VSLHKEISFEDEICEHLSPHGWRYEKGDAGYIIAEQTFDEAAVQAGCFGIDLSRS